MEPLRPLPLKMWRSQAGNEPTRDWFKSLPDADRKVLGIDLRQLQFAWPVGMPLVRSMGNRLWELRTSLPSRREARVLFAVDGEYIAILHGFIKKSQKTPDHELALARKRLKETHK
jgi:phage-related protein